MKGNNLPFRRLTALMNSLAGLNTLEREKALGAYESRGHGTGGKPARNLFKNARGQHYPHHSTRQENWSYRRAQGGPGLDSSNTPRQ